MQLNADFSQRVAINSVDLDWVDSPLPGVQRRMLDRLGDEVARATSIVRYAPNSSFSPHVHTGGEEYIVLEGVFQDEHGDFPEGAYVRNPPQSRHTPRSEPGCIIFVKLWQFDLDDRTDVAVNLKDLDYAEDPNRPGARTAALFHDAREDVVVEKWRPGAPITIASDGGIELLVLDGSISERNETLTQHGWLRVPDGDQLEAAAGPDGAWVWLKTGHLRHVRAPR